MWALIFKMAAIARDSSRFAGIKTVSEKFSQPEVDADGRVRKVCDQFLKLKDLKGFLQVWGCLFFPSCAKGVG